MCYFIVVLFICPSIWRKITIYLLLCICAIFLYLFLHDFLLLLAWVFMYFFNYSFGQKVLCNGLLWGHTRPLFTDKGQQSGEVLQALIDLCNKCILMFSLRFAFYYCLELWFWFFFSYEWLFIFIGKTYWLKNWCC